MMPGSAAGSNFQAALLVSLLVHLGLSAITPSGVVQADKISVLPLAVRLIERDPIPVTPRARSTSKPGANRPATVLESARFLPAPAQPVRDEFSAVPVATSADHVTSEKPAAPESSAGDPAAPAPLQAAADQTESGSESGEVRSTFASYGRRLAEVLSRHQHYPRLARVRGWQGQVRLRLHLARHGSVLDIEITKSSGYDVLDQQALEIVRLASPLPVPPGGISSDKFVVDVPVTFRLEHS